MINKLFIVMYHYTRDLPHSRYPHIKGLDLPLFKQQLEFFQNHFNVVRMEDVLASLPSIAGINTGITPPHQRVLNQSPSSTSQDIHSREADRGSGSDGNSRKNNNSCGKIDKHTVGNGSDTTGTAYSSTNSKPALLLTFDDGYIDNYTFAAPLLEQFGFQGSFFIPGKTFTEHKLLDVNKIHYILASAEGIDPNSSETGIKRLVSDLFEKMDYYRGYDFDYPSNNDLYAEWAVPNRFDSGDVVFIKRILQTVLPEPLRNRISSDLFESYVGVSETQLAYELYMTPDQIKSLKKRGMYIGLHGYDHYWLGRLQPEQMRADIDKALEVMTGFGVIEPDRWVMNYPYGNYSQEVVRYVTECGCVCGLTTEVRVAEIGKDDRMKLPRLDCNDFPPKSENYQKLWAQTEETEV